MVIRQRGHTRSYHIWSDGLCWHLQRLHFADESLKSFVSERRLSTVELYDPIAGASKRQEMTTDFDKLKDLTSEIYQLRPLVWAENVFKIVKESKYHSLKFLDIYYVSNTRARKYQNIDVKFLKITVVQLAYRMCI